MSATEISGNVAAGLVFLTFYMKTMVPLRIIGICSNCAFITYGGLGACRKALAASTSATTQIIAA
jgi:hypothetical protein